MTPATFDTLSAPVRRLLDDARRSGAYAQLVVRGAQTQPNSLDGVVNGLERLNAEDLFDAPVTRPESARCALAGLCLFVDELDRAHGIVQELASPDGSFWHAIVHRREGDFSNSRYWYARCAGHPVLARLADAGPDARVGPALVDLVARAHDRLADDELRAQAVALQRLEWQALFDHCARAAVGR